MAVAVGVVVLFVVFEDDGTGEEVQSRDRSRRKKGCVSSSVSIADGSIAVSLSRDEASCRLRLFLDGRSSADS